MFWPSRRATELDTRYDNVSIHPTAEIAGDVEIGPFTIIGPYCKVGPGNRLHNNVTLVQGVQLGKNNELFPGAILGGLPQDKKYRGEESLVVVGHSNVIRENVTINSGTKLGGSVTLIGDRNLIMASCHLAHDCILENDIAMANNVLLGGHVRVESFASFGGLAAVHHFVTVGQHAFVGGLTRVAQDVSPYMLLEGNPSRIWSINKVGLRRRGFKQETMHALKVAHRLLFRSDKPRAEVVEYLLATFPEVKEIRILRNFLRATEAGHQGRARQPLTYESDEVTSLFRTSPHEGENRLGADLA